MLLYGPANARNLRARHSLPKLLVCAALTLCACARGQDAPKSWPFEPPTDTFRADAILDLRSLNEKTAGETGFVQRTPDGDFALGNGKPVRFWAVDEYVQNLEGMDA